ncbi:MAG: endolytic transglycosylase MltG, partial [Candidatus Liptonbacteria bacterium]|nr:endolytic transglycosylase MltG [Candidatus Liptonbacteria bacterium]
SFKVYAFFRGLARDLKPGAYELNPAMSGGEILRVLVHADRRAVTIRVPEGSSSYAIDTLLSDAGVLPRGSFAAQAAREKLEGKLFPDTYRLFTRSTPSEVADVFLENFDEKAMPALPRDPEAAHRALVLASLVEREVPDFEERRLVAGIFLKRLEQRVPLQVDASFCYIKEQRAFLAGARPGSCLPLTELDLKVDSPYNTYLYRGLPPGPIGSPGRGALEAVLSPRRSSYWYYLSDPASKKTIFAVTLDEHAKNKLRYLE